jgi:hypothetical protein
MLREDKNVVTETLSMVRDPATGALCEVKQLIETAEVRVLGARQSVSVREAELKQLPGPPFLARDYYKKSRRLARESLARARRDLVEAQEQLNEVRSLVADGGRVAVYRLHSKKHFVEFSEYEFTQHAATQQVAPVLVTTWEGRRWWWYLSRFWWDSEGLEAADGERGRRG